MPRLTRRESGPGPAVTLRAVMALMIGADFSFLAPKEEPVDHRPLSAAVLQEAWDAIGEPLAAWYSQTFPAHRPVGWWRFAAPQARRHVRQGGVCVDTWWLPHEQALLLEDDEDASDEDLECSCRYLHRLKLLLPQEQTRRHAHDWPGCRDENPEAWRSLVLTCTDLREWLQREYGRGEEP